MEDYTFTAAGGVHTVQSALARIAAINATNGDMFELLASSEALSAHTVPEREHRLREHLKDLDVYLDMKVKAHVQGVGNSVRVYDSYYSAMEGIPKLAADSRVLLVEGQYGYSCEGDSTVGR